MDTNFFENLLKSVPVGVLALTFHGKITYINNLAINLLDLDSSSLTNINILDKIPTFSKYISNSKKTYLEKNIIIHKNKKNISCTLSTINQDDYLSGYIIVLNNIDIVNSSIKKPSFLHAKYVFDDIVGESPQLKRVINECKELASNSCSIMITGESGSGKELLAQSIHNASPRNNNPFIAVNCGAIPKNLIESELFGYESGSFTGAKLAGSQGKFQQANGGTIFLDEIGEMPLDMQVTLLRVLQEKSITKIGGKESIPIDIRVISATNKDLKEEIKKGRFREDLYYRLTVFPVDVPPLKDRIGDIPILLDHFLKVKSESLNKPIPKISEESFKKIISYCWPGNIRELENFIENIIVLDGLSSFKIDLAECHCLTHDNLGNMLPLSSLPIESCEENITPLIILEQKEIKRAIQLCDGNMTKVAAKLGISRNALYNKIKRYSIIVNRPV